MPLNQTLREIDTETYELTLRSIVNPFLNTNENITTDAHEAVVMGTCLEDVQFRLFNAHFTGDITEALRIRYISLGAGVAGVAVAKLPTSTGIQRDLGAYCPRDLSKSAFDVITTILKSSNNGVNEAYMEMAGELHEDFPALAACERVLTMLGAKKGLDGPESASFKLGGFAVNMGLVNLSKA